MHKLVFIFISFLILGCTTNKSFVDLLKPEFETMSFDVVQKQLVFEKELPDHLQSLISQWFNQKVNIDGFDGDMKFIISNFKQDISSISDGKRVDASLSFKVLLNKPSLSQTKAIEGNVSSFGELTGNFSLAEFDTVIENTQSDLILRLSRDLKSKI